MHGLFVTFEVAIDQNVLINLKNCRSTFIVLQSHLLAEIFVVNLEISKSSYKTNHKHNKF